MIDNAMSNCSRALRSDPGDQEQARAERADDGSEGVGGVDTRHISLAGILFFGPPQPRAPTGNSRPTGASAAAEPKTRGRGRARKLNQMFERSRGRSASRGAMRQVVRGPGDRAAASNWHQPNATRGRARIRQSNEPMPLPIPRPVRKTATMMESV